MNDVKMLNQDQVDAIVLYKEIEERLNKNKVTMWKVLRYATTKGLFFGDVRSSYALWKKFSLTHKGISYTRMKNYAEFVERFCSEPPEIEPTAQFHDIKALVRDHNISLRDLYDYWLDYNTTHNIRITTCSYRTFEDCFHRRVNKSTSNGFGPKRLQEIYTVIELMLKENYHYTKKTKKNDKFIWNNLTKNIK